MTRTSQIKNIKMLHAEEPKHFVIFKKKEGAVSVGKVLAMQAWGL